MKIILAAIKNPDKAFRVLFDIAFSPFDRLDFKPFIVLSRSRTGSNMLISFLNSHPNIRAVEREIFSKLDGQNYGDILARVFAKQPYYIEAKGFKIFYYHPLDDRNEDIWNALVNMENLRVIHLKRRNILRTLVSRKIASLQDVWSTTASIGLDSSKNKAVSFTVQEVEDGIKQTRAWEKEGDEKFRNHPLLLASYEDLVADPIGHFKKITEFLGVGYVRPQTNLKKQNPEKLSDLVSNYDELKSKSQGKEWRQFLED